MEAATTNRIKVVIDSKPAVAGKDDVIRAMREIANASKQLSSANDNVGKGLEGIGNSASKSAGQARGATAAFQELQKVFGGVSGELGTFGARASGAASSLGSFSSAGRAIAGLGMAGVLGGIAVAFTAIGVAGLQAASEVQQFKANLLTMTGSIEAADQAYQGLVQFAKTTPFDLKQSIEGFTMLRSLGLSTSKEIMTSYGNTAAAMGKSMDQMINAVADATTGEFERLKEFGIKAKQSGDSVAFTFQGVTTKVGNNAAEIEKYLVGIGNTQFAGAMERQMQGLNGAFSNFGDTIFQLVATLGDGPFGAAVADIINTISSGISAVTPLISGIMDIFGGIVSAAWDMAKGLTSVFTGGTQGASNFQAILDGLAVTFSFIGETIGVVGSVFGSVFSFIADLGSTVVNGLAGGFSDYFGWFSTESKTSGQTMSESLVGILRAAQFVAKQLPTIFKTALNDLKNAFGQLGAAIAAALTGDFSKFKNIDLSFKATKGIVADTYKGAVQTQQDQKANRAWIDSRTSRGSDGNIDFAATRGAGAAGSGKDKKGKADNTAQRQNDFWAGMEKELELSKLNTQEAAKRNKELEVEKLYGKQINDLQITRIIDGKKVTLNAKEYLASLMQQIELNKFLQGQAENHSRTIIDLQGQEAVLALRKAGATQEQLAIETDYQKIIGDAKEKHIALDTQALTLIRQQVTEEYNRKKAIDAANKAIDDGIALASKYSTTQQGRDKQKELTDGVAAINAAFGAGKYGTGAEAERIRDEAIKGLTAAVTVASNDFETKFGSRIDALANLFGGKFGEAIRGLKGLFDSLARSAKGDFSGLGALGSIGTLFGTKGVGADGKAILNSFGTAFQQGSTKVLTDLFSSSTWSKPFKSMGDSLKGLTDSFGKGGGFFQGMGNLLGTAAGGAQIGGTIAGLGNALGIKMSNTGAQIGGAVGSFLGPVGSIVGSIAGGLLGGLFKKVKSGYAQVRDSAVTGTYGRTGDFQTQAAEMATSLLGNFRQIAEQLDTTFGKVSFDIGKKDDKFGFTGGGQQTQWFSSETEAVTAALRYVVSQGAFEGISDTVKRLLQTGDIEAQLQKAIQFQNTFKELNSLTKPVTYAVNNFNSEMKKLGNLFNEAGASASEFADLEALRQAKLKTLMEEQTKGYADLLKSINGEAGGTSKLTLLNQDMAKLAGFKSTIAAGGQIDQAEFTALGQEILGYASDLYGTNTAKYQSVISSLRDATGGAMTNVLEQITKGTADSANAVSAINNQTNVVASEIAKTNDLLSQLLQKWGVSLSSAQMQAINGVMTTVN